MAKTTSKKQNNRADPISKKAKEAKEKAPKEKTPKEKGSKEKAGHLYTDDNPETALQGGGFKDAAAADKTSRSTIRSLQTRAKPYLRTPLCAEI